MAIKKSKMMLLQRLVNPNPEKKLEKIRLSEGMFIQSNSTGVWSLYQEKPNSNEKKYLVTIDLCMPAKHEVDLAEIQELRKLSKNEKYQEFFDIVTSK